ncbi:MAG: hypothetical protein ACI9KE_000499 [Polyangiales bacterium]|jgi:hypothetical protein
MKRAHLLLAAAAILCLGCVAAVADALVVTDEERLEAFVDAVSGEVSSERIDDALSFAQTDQLPVTLRAGSSESTYDNRDAALARRVRQSIEPFLGTDAELIQHDIRVDGDEADVHLRVRTTRGSLSASIELEKVDGRWLIAETTLR